MRSISTALLLGVALGTCQASGAAGEIESTLLAPRSTRSGSTMFTPLPPEQTGIVAPNRFADPKMWNEHYQELIFGEVGTGVAIGDYDGDGRPDVFVVSKTEGGRLFRNLGGWKFEEVTVAAGLGEPASDWMDTAKGWIGLGKKSTIEAPEFWRQGATFVDVNNDGRLDLYVCRFGAPNQLFINQGDGTFKEEAAGRGLAVVDGSCMAEFCDYDRDGWLDAFIHTNMLDVSTHPAGRRSFLFHNDGSGTFTNVTDRAGILGEAATHAATWWDYDGDGWPDLYVSNDYAPADVLYHNNCDGTFTNAINATVPHMAYYAMGSDCGDVNNDGLTDLFVADMSATNHEKDFRGMAGARVRAQLEPKEPNEPPQYMRNALYLNTGAGRMLEAAHLAGVAATDWTWSPRFEDLDNDGRLDLFVTNGMIREYHNADLLARVMATENLAIHRKIVRESPALDEANMAFRNLGDLRFENVSAAWGLDQKGVSFGSAFGDLDGDGDLDLVFANYEGGPTVLRNDSDTGHRLVVALRGTRSNRFGVGATVKIENASGIQVRTLILARGYLSSSEPVLHFGLGDEAQIKRLTIVWPSGAIQTFIDLPADRRYTFTESSEPTSATQPNADGANSPRAPLFRDVTDAVNFSIVSRPTPPSTRAQPLLPWNLNVTAPTMLVTHLRADGRPDVMVGPSRNEGVRAFRFEQGRFAPEDLGGIASGSAGFDGPMIAFDANGDGATDLLLTKTGVSAAANAPGYQAKLWLNDGHDAFQAASEAALPPIPISVGALAAVDFDHDRMMDVFVGARSLPGKYPLPPRSALLANRGGQFEDVTDSVAPGLREAGMVTSAVWSDVDSDGWPDLVITLDWGGVRYWHNDHGVRFEDWSERAGFDRAGAGWWRAIATGDFNGDDKPDFAVGNVGLNTMYEASEQQPAVVYYGAFGTGTRAQLIEAFYEGGRLFPRRTRNELGTEIPAILKRFPQNDEYARATLPEILGEERLAAARRFVATELQSGVLLSQPDGRYRFEPFPRIAQISPINAFAIADFDGDGLLDLVALQNSDEPVASIGHFDGGLGQYLRGDGHGHFTAVPASESGLIVPGDARGVVVCDINDDGAPDLLITRHAQPSLVFTTGHR